MSVRKLNISAQEKYVLLRALSVTTHPSAFADIKRGVEQTLRHQSYPNFLQRSIRNGNDARIHFAICLGMGTILLGVAYAILTILSGIAHGYRAFCAVFFFFGAVTLYAAMKGMCVVLHSFHHRQIRPWEFFVDDVELAVDLLDPAGTVPNSYETEPWVVNYASRNFIRKIFDKQVYIQNRALRHIQDIIFTQAVIYAALGTALFTVILVYAPGHVNLI
jgi:hypothetical protein